MKNRKLIAYTLLGLGALMLFNNPFTNSLTWFWTALIAGFVYWEYKQRKTSGLLLTSTSLAGLSVGILLEHNLGFPGFIFLSSAASLAIYKRRSKDDANWLDYVIGSLAVLGFLILFISFSFLNSSWFALALIVAGLYFIKKESKTNKVANKPNKEDLTSKTSKTKVLNDIGEELFKEDIKDRDIIEAKEVDIDLEASNKTEVIETEYIKRDSKEVIEIAEELVKKGTKTSLLKRLKNWRKQKATELDIKETAIFNDISLKDLVAKKPQNDKELLAVKGIGKIKLERYGKELLEIIKN